MSRSRYTEGEAGWSEIMNAKLIKRSDCSCACTDEGAKRIWQGKRLGIPLVESRNRRRNFERVVAYQHSEGAMCRIG